MSSFITAIDLFNAKAIAQAGTASVTIDLSRYNCQGFFSLQILLTGDGNVDAVWSVSNDGTNFITPSGTDPIFDDFAKTSGPGSNGKDIASFDPPLARWLKITFTENNSDSVAVTAHLALQ